MGRSTHTDRSHGPSGRGCVGRLQPSPHDSSSVTPTARAPEATVPDRGVAPRANGSSEERYRQLVESVRAIPWEVDLATWRFTYVGPQAVEILGYPLEDWYSEGFWAEHLHPEDRGEMRRVRREAEDG